jgi:hypothetical protein
LFCTGIKNPTGRRPGGEEEPNRVLRLFDWFEDFQENLLFLDLLMMVSDSSESLRSVYTNLLLFGVFNPSEGEEPIRVLLPDPGYCQSQLLILGIASLFVVIVAALVVPALLLVALTLLQSVA